MYSNIKNVLFFFDDGPNITKPGMPGVAEGTGDIYSQLLCII
jgi:hypothetical protein